MLNTFEKNHTDVIRRIDKQAVDLKAMYSPGRVQVVADDAQTAIEEVLSKAKSALGEIRASVKKTGLILFGFAVCAVLASTTIVWFGLKVTPTLEEMIARRDQMEKAAAEVEGLTVTAGKLNSQIRSLAAQFVFINGENWVRTESLPPRSWCPDEKRPDICAYYVRVR